LGSRSAEDTFFRHARGSGHPESISILSLLDSRSPITNFGDKLHGNDVHDFHGYLLTFCFAPSQTLSSSALIP
jgi:hypothetical protein